MWRISRTKLRSDIVVDYREKQYVIECKIWHGDAYNQREEELLGNLPAPELRQL